MSATIGSGPSRSAGPAGAPQKEGPMLHTPATSDRDPASRESPSGTVANPRRTRLGPDGLPVPGPVSPSAD